MRLILGEVWEHRSPVKTYSPLIYIHADAPAGSAIDLPRGHGELAAYVVSGLIETGGEPVSAGHMAVFAPGEAPVIRVRADSRLMILGGANIGERHIDWNFVSSSKARIEQAKTGWRASIAGGFKKHALRPAPRRTRLDHPARRPPAGVAAGADGRLPDELRGRLIRRLFKNRIQLAAPGAVIALQQAFGGADSGAGDGVEIVEEERLVLAMGVEAGARFQAGAGDGEDVPGNVLQSAGPERGF